MMNKTRIHRLKQLTKDRRGSARMKLMLESGSGSGEKRVGGREKKATWKGEPANNLKRKHQLKEWKGFARVGWILDYRLQEEIGWAGGKRKQLRIELGKDEDAWVNLTRNASDKKSWEPTLGKTNRVILKKDWRGRGVIQNTYVKIPHQSDEGAEE